MASKRKFSHEPTASLEKDDFSETNKFDLIIQNGPSDKCEDLSEDDDSSNDDSSVYSGLEEEDDTDESSDTSSRNDIENKEMELFKGDYREVPTLKNPDKPDEYEFDSSDEEDIRNTIGNVPIEWYNDFPHIGYDWDGKQIMKPAAGDELDEFLEKMDNPDYWRTVKDKMTGQKVLLTDEEIDIIQRIQRGRYPEANYNPYEPFIDFFTNEVMIHPVTNRPEHKRSFIPSLIEKEKVSKMVHAIKMGWIKPKPKPEEGPVYFMLWENDEKAELNRRMQHYIAAPKVKLPGHGESYNPPPEYLPMKRADDPNKVDKFQKRFSCLRHVPAYSKFINERFERCLDLYLCPRQRKTAMNISPEDLLPQLPKPKDLQPFPSIESLIYKGHKGFVRCISVEPTGQFLASGSDDKTIRVWEVSTARCLRRIKVPGTVKSIAWCPNTSICILALAVENKVYLLNPGVGDKLCISDTDKIFDSESTAEETSETTSEIKWQTPDDQLKADGYRLVLEHQKPVRQITWHARGDYFASVMPDGGNKSVVIHQLTKRRSQNPFRKTKGLVQCVLFHPSRPYFFLATQRYVRIYNLLKQELSKKLLTNCRWISSMAVHPQGDNVIIGGYDCKLGWFDLDLSTKPYRILRHHKKAVRQVCFHKRYPLFASASDDGTVIVCHGMVYNDLLQNPLIVPVKVLRGHSIVKDIGVLDCQFHPTQPWIFSSGSDTTIRLFT